MRERLRRLLDLLVPRGERLTVLVDDSEHQYRFFYDGRGRPVLEFVAGGVGQYPVRAELTKEQHQGWLREGAPYIRKLYWELLLAHKQGELYPFAPEVAEALARDYPEPTRPIAAKLLRECGYGAPEEARVQLALLRLARGDVHALKRHLVDARVDHRIVLRRAGEVDPGTPLPNGATGIDSATGRVVAEEITISPGLTRAAFLASPAFEDGLDNPGEVGEFLASARDLTLADTTFSAVLLFYDEQLVEVHLGPKGDLAAAPWLNAHVPDWQGIFAWGSLDLEPDGFVVRYA